MRNIFLRVQLRRRRTISTQNTDVNNINIIVRRKAIHNNRAKKKKKGRKIIKMQPLYDRVEIIIIIFQEIFLEPNIIVLLLL